MITQDLLPSLTNLPVFYTVLVSLAVMLLAALFSLYARVRGETEWPGYLFWLKLTVVLPLWVLVGVWTYLGTYWLGFATLVSGVGLLMLLTPAPLAIYGVMTWGLVRWIRGKRFGDASVVLIILAFVSIIYGYQRAWLCEPLAHSGLGRAQLCTAKLYESGEGGVIRDRGAARAWYQKAADHRLAEAEFWIGMHTSDRAERRQWLTRAAEQGHSPAAYRLFLLLGPEHDDALDWLQFAVREGYPPAMYRLGLLHSNGYRVPHDMERTRKLWQRSAEAGHVTAMRALALAYARGVLFDIDLDASIQWEQKALAASTGEDRTRLPADEHSFVQVWRTQLARLRARAAIIAAGDPNAQRQLSRDILKQAQDDASVRNKGIRMLEQGGDQSDPDAQYEIADHYLGLEDPSKGKLKKGLEWLTKAAENGHHTALRRLIEAFKEGRYGVEVDLYAAKRYSERFFAVLEQNNVKRNDTAWLAPTWDYQDTLKQIKRIEHRGVPLDKLKAQATNGDSAAQYRLAKDLAFYERDAKKALEWLDAAARGGHVQAQYEMARRIRSRPRTDDEERQAIAWFKTAATASHRGAMVELGHLYMAGLPRQHIERNYYRAKIFYERSVDGQDKIVYQQQTAHDRSWYISVDSIKRRLARIPDFMMRLDLEGLDGNARTDAINAWYAQEHAQLIVEARTASGDTLSEFNTALATLESQRDLLLLPDRG